MCSKIFTLPNTSCYIQAYQISKYKPHAFRLHSIKHFQLNVHKSIHTSKTEIHANKIKSPRTQKPVLQVLSNWHRAHSNGNKTCVHSPIKLSHLLSFPCICLLPRCFSNQEYNLTRSYPKNFSLTQERKITVDRNAGEAGQPISQRLAMKWRYRHCFYVYLKGIRRGKGQSVVIIDIQVKVCKIKCIKYKISFSFRLLSL